MKSKSFSPRHFTKYAEDCQASSTQECNGADPHKPVAARNVGRAAPARHKQACDEKSDADQQQKAAPQIG
jgi:hypothetical protein